MPPVPQFRFFLSDDDHPVHKNLFPWNAAMPLSPGAFPGERKASATTALSYGEYFEAVVDFLSAQFFRPVCDVVSSLVKRTVDYRALREIKIYVEKHGAFYHPARILVSVEQSQVLFVLNVAVSNIGKAYLEGEYHQLVRLRKNYLFDYIPMGYWCGRVQVDSDRELKMFLGEWFEGYHEFHVSAKVRHNSRPVVVWDGGKRKVALTKEQAQLVCEEATAILTAYYNLETFEHIFSWHHAAGDFVVNLESKNPRVKLVSVRRYAKLIDSRDNGPILKVNALLLFLVKLSIQMRLDRVDGVGETVWIDDFTAAGIVRGFFKGLQLSAVPDAFVEAFRGFLKGFSGAELLDLFNAVVSRMPAGHPDLAAIRPNLKNHVASFLQAIPMAGSRQVL